MVTFLRASSLLTVFCIIFITLIHNTNAAPAPQSPYYSTKEAVTTTNYGFIFTKTFGSPRVELTLNNASRLFKPNIARNDPTNDFFNNFYTKYYFYCPPSSIQVGRLPGEVVGKSTSSGLTAVVGSLLRMLLDTVAPTMDVSAMLKTSFLCLDPESCFLSHSRPETMLGSIDRSSSSAYDASSNPILELNIESKDVDQRRTSYLEY
ncbi:hypothetical protein BG015_011859 [Linnemannia schmuckeri]|uniref:Uncharacterized protein n=1 Tax=Linnemannia schmuckeri TaxID=64567 RepID=A0A9P5S831_9FUNG|nr:hypothetical protein BG015_011859 [Linnemannia schmuckeri]